MVVYGASSGATSGKRVQIYYNSDTDFGFFATDAAGNCLARFGSANQIAGWNIDASRIYKNNIALGADGSITNGSKWKLNNDGSGSIASGNISWNAAGAVTFSAAVSLNWTNAANSALASAKTYADTKKTEAVNAAAADATSKSDAAKELARAMAFGKMLYRDPTFRNGNNSVNVYNNAGNGTVTITRTGASAPNDSGYVLEIKTTGSASPGFGGFYFATGAGYRKIFIARIIAKIPTGRQIAWATNSIGTGGSSKWLTPTAGTGDWCEYIYKVVCGTASFSSTNFFYLTGGAAATADAPVTWQVAYATVFDVTSSERYTTTINANGIYTGTLTAAQVNAVAIDAGSIRTGTLSADRIAAGSINSSKLDAASIKSNIINTDYINGLTCTFVRGKIGGWTIGTDNITAGNVGAVGAMPIQIRSAASGSGYWYSGAYKPLGIVMTWHQSSNAGHVVFGQIAASGNTVKTGFLGIQMMTWDHVEYFCLSANYTKSGAKEIYNRIAGWAFDNSRIWKNNVSLGADGSINNGSVWSLKNDGAASFGNGNISFGADGAGYVANRNIQWDTAGNVTINGTITATAGQIAGFTIKGNKLVNTASDSSIEFSSMIGNASLYINSGSSLISMRADSSRTGISIQTYASGARGMYILANAGSSYAIEAYGPMQMGQRAGERWCMPGVLYVGCKYSTGYNSYYRKIWGDGITISSFAHIGDGKYRVSHNLGHTDYTVIAILWANTAYYGFFRLLERNTTSFVIQNLGSSGKPDGAAFDFVIIGRNKW